MNKTKLYSIISVLIIIILFSSAAWCGPGLLLLKSIGWKKPVIDPQGPTGVTLELYKIHGVEPTKVTAHYSFTGPGGRWDYFLKIWNVGSIGGEQYREAIMDAALAEPFEGVEPLKTVFEGYFTGGPNGNIYLTGKIDGKESSVAFKLYDGKEVIMSPTVSFLIDNPEAFKGWVD
jgi:hypothetical protein